VGKVVSSVGRVLGFGGGGGGPGPKLAKAPFDLSKESVEYKQFFDKQRAEAEARQAAAQTPQLIEALRKQALGQGPSLAEAQLKSATNRNLAQQLSLAAGMRGRNPAASQRQILQQQGEAGRQLADAAAQARLQESQQAQQTLLQQQQLADALAQQSGQTGFNVAVEPKRALQQFESQRFGADVARREGIRQQQSGILGGLLGAAGTIGGAMVGGPAGAAVGGAVGSAVGGGAGGARSIRMADGGRVRAEQPAEREMKQPPKAEPPSLLDVLVEGLKPGAWDRRGRPMHKANGGRAKRVPGEAKVAGDSRRNDTMLAVLSPDEIVIPRTASSSPEKASAFVEQLFANEGYFEPAMKSKYSKTNKAPKKVEKDGK
jgi:hypothetical protein